MGQTEGQIVDVIGGAKIESGTTDMVRAAVSVIPPAEALLTTKAWAPIKAQIEAAASKAVLVTVKTPEDKATATLWAKLLHPVVSKLDEKRLELARAIKERLIEPINAAMTPTIKTGQAAVKHLNDQISLYNEAELDKWREQQRQNEAAADRSLKAQAAAVAKGGQARKEIVVAAAPKPDTIESDNTMYFRLSYDIVDEAAVPKAVEFNGQQRQICTPDAGLIRSLVNEMEAGYSKEQKGYTELPQPIPGITFKWKQCFTRA
jgi:hypothetical protein